MAERGDAIVVGLGAAGGIVAEQLCQAGLQVIGVEKGPDYTEGDHFEIKQDEIRYYVRGALAAGMDTDPVTWRAKTDEEAAVLPWSAGPVGADEPLYGLPSTGTGGGSVHWGGAAFRFRESDFRMRTTIIDRFGANSLPDDTTLVDWPITYSDLEPYYDRVEWEQGISGRAGNIRGEIQPGGNPFEAPRGRDYPMEPLIQGPSDHRFVEACERLGLHPYPLPVGINSREYKGRSGCVYCGFCHGYPCHVGAKSTTQVTSIPAAKATGNLTLLEFARATSVLRRPDGGVRGIAYIDSTGTEREIEAEVVVLSAYALENARLLLVSGVNESGQVGRHYMTHNYGWFYSVLP
ncbi:MAG: GMC family oxidoreductase N-terminal domain-containing protein, partial [Actinomycetota bacterium]